MELAGLIGIYLFLFYIYKKVKKVINLPNGEKYKKELVKELLPIILLAIYLIWTLIACIFAKNTKNAFYGNGYRKEGYITYLIYAGFFGSAFLIKSTKIKKVLLNIFVMVVILNIAIMKLVYLNTDLSKYFYFKEMKDGVFENSNHYGYYLLMSLMTACFLFITEKKWMLKICYVMAYTFILYILIKNNTFGCYLAGAVTLILFLIWAIRNKKYLKSSVVVIVIFVTLSCIVSYNGENIAKKNVYGLFEDICKILGIEQKQEGEEKSLKKSWQSAGSGRAKLWKYGLNIFLKKPILGYGAENLKVEYEKYNIDADRPHNLLIQLATTSGIPGLLLYVFAIAIILIRGIKYLKVADDEVYLVAFFVVLAYLISAMFGNSMYYTSPYFFIFLGFIMNRHKIELRANKLK